MAQRVFGRRSKESAFTRSFIEQLENGTRPDGRSGPWTNEEFHQEIERTGVNVAIKTVRAWRQGRLPSFENLRAILISFFGVDEDHPQRLALKRFWDQSRQRSSSKSIFEFDQLAQPEHDPAGATWIIRGDQLAIDRSFLPTDTSAAADPLRQQLQSVVREIASELVGPAARLSNSRTWGSLSTTAHAFHTIVNCEPQLMPTRLGEAYARLLRLGRYLETDGRLQRDPTSSDDPLDPEIHGLLTDLVRTAAPWLRGFPTVAAWDDDAGRALVRPELFQPAREFTDIARLHNVIAAGDAEEIQLLMEASDSHDYQGQKAGNRAVGNIRNLILASASTIALFLSGAVASDFSTRSPLVQHLGMTLAAAETQIEAFAINMQADLRQALRSIIREGRQMVPIVSPAQSDLQPRRNNVRGKFVNKNSIRSKLADTGIINFLKMTTERPDVFSLGVALIFKKVAVTYPAEPSGRKTIETGILGLSAIEAVCEARGARFFEMLPFEPQKYSIIRRINEPRDALGILSGSVMYSEDFVDVTPTTLGGATVTLTFQCRLKNLVFVPSPDRNTESRHSAIALKRFLSHLGFPTAPQDHIIELGRIEFVWRPDER